VVISLTVMKHLLLSDARGTSRHKIQWWANRNVNSYTPEHWQMILILPLRRSFPVVASCIETILLEGYCGINNE